MDMEYGMCHECGKPIRPACGTGRDFRWALPDWLCAYCYYSKFGPDTEPQWPDPEDIFRGSYIENEESYEFLKAHLCAKPNLYEPSFGFLKPYSIFLRSFDSLRHLLRFNTGLRCRRIPSLRRGASFRRKVKAELLNLGLARYDLRPAIIAVLMLVLWDDLVKQYGTGEEFSNSYWELMMEFEPQITQIKDTNEH
jgi:hypothetical protein